MNFNAGGSRHSSCHSDHPGGDSALAASPRAAGSEAPEARELSDSNSRLAESPTAAGECHGWPRMMTIPVGTLLPPAVWTLSEGRAAGRVTNHSERAGLALRIRLKMPAKRKRMTNDECDSVPLAHKTAESDRSRKLDEERQWRNAKGRLHVFA